MLNTYISLFKNKEIRNKILFTLAMLLVYRLGAGIPAPRIDAVKIMSGVTANSVVSMMNLLGGGSMTSFSIFALGVGPYLTASIIIQLLSMDIIPYLSELSKSGQQGRLQIDKITRYLAVVMGFVQAFIMVYAYDVSYGIVINGSVSNYLYIATILTAGTLFLCWLGDRISQKGIGNGMSMIIFAGIVADLPFEFVSVFRELTESGVGKGIALFVLYVILYIILIIGVIYVSQAERRIPIQYSNSGGSYGRDMTFLPLKINSASVMPVIFAQAVMTGPATIMSFFPSNKFTEIFTTVFNMQKWWGVIIYFFLIIVFTFFYTSLEVDPEKIAENLGKNGSYIPGVRPGADTKKYISDILNRITCLGAVCLAGIAVLPYVLSMVTPLPASVSLGGTGIIIIVGVALETMKDLTGQLTQRSYRGFGR